MGECTPCSENKGADQLRGCSAPLFSHMQTASFLMTLNVVKTFDLCSLELDYCLCHISTKRLYDEDVCFHKS